MKANKYTDDAYSKYRVATKAYNVAMTLYAYSVEPTPKTLLEVEYAWLLLAATEESRRDTKRLIPEKEGMIWFHGLLALYARGVLYSNMSGHDSALFHTHFSESQEENQRRAASILEYLQ